MNQRRKLELELIDAAMKLDSYIEMSCFKRNDREDRLHEAVLRYSLYGLAEPRFTRTVLSAPETSHEAGEWMKQFALTDACAVFRRIFWAHHGGYSLLPVGLTCDEVEEELDRTHQSISARVNELRDSGWIVDSGHRRKTRSGRAAIVWTPTQAALDLVDRVGLPIPITVNKKGTSDEVQ